MDEKIPSSIPATKKFPLKSNFSEVDEEEFFRNDRSFTKLE
jgi:hypothetical protein